MSTISSRLKDILVDKGLNRKDAAEATGVAESTIQRYLSGYTGTIPSDKLSKIAKGLRIPAAYLLGTGPFEEWDSIQTHLPEFICALEDEGNILSCIFDIDKDRPYEIKISDLILYIDLSVEDISYFGSSWRIKYKNGHVVDTDPDASAEYGKYLDLLQARPECRTLLSLAADSTKTEVEAAIAMLQALRGG